MAQRTICIEATATAPSYTCFAVRHCIKNTAKACPAVRGEERAEKTCVHMFIEVRPKPIMTSALAKPLSMEYHLERTPLHAPVTRWWLHRKESIPPNLCWPTNSYSTLQEKSTMFHRSTQRNFQKKSCTPPSPSVTKWAINILEG